MLGTVLGAVLGAVRHAVLGAGRGEPRPIGAAPRQQATSLDLVGSTGEVEQRARSAKGGGGL